MRLDHLLSKEIIFLLSCVIVLVACGYFLFLGGTPTGQITEVMVVCARVMIKRLWCFPFLCWLVVGALLGVWDDTCVVVPV